MKKSQSFLFAAACLFVLFAAFNLIFWFYISSDYSLAFLEAKEKYLSYYPHPLNNAVIQSLAGIIIMIIASIIFYRTAKKTSLNILPKILLGVSLFLMAVNMWSIM